MTFKVGDKVQYIGDCRVFSGREGGYQPAEGVVTEPDSHGATRLQLTRPVEGYKIGREVGLLTRNLELIKEEPAFTFKDIQVGDKIRRTLKRKSGATEVREGTVERLQGSYAMDYGYILAYVNDDKGLTSGHSVVLELLDRPKKPEIWETCKPGDKIATYTAEGKFERVFTKREDDRWDTLVVNTDGKLQLGFERSDKDIELHAQHCGITLQLVK